MSPRTAIYRPQDPYTESAAVERERKATNSANARARKRAGDGLEGQLARAHAQYQERGLGVLTKLNPAVRGNPNPSAGSRGLYFAGKGACDYMGWIKGTTGSAPVPVAFDAKHTQEASMRLPKNPKDARSLLNQIAFLRAFGTGPALAFLLVVDTEMGFGWYLLDDALAALERGEVVPLRSKLRGDRVEHHQPMFPLTSTIGIVMGAPYVDWRAGLTTHGLL